MFCIVKGFESLGRAKVLDAIGENWKVEYFDSPAQIARDVRAVQKARIVSEKLGANTRIYYQHVATGQWLVGRVLQDMGDGVEVRFADKNDVFIDYEHLFVRCKKLITDPVDYLANVITETPQYAEARSGFMASYISQRGAAWGISALLSSVIELETHQINVIRRILNDPSQRYLLADEVGLGKTIEAMETVVEIYNWVMNLNDPNPFSFNNCCKVSGLDPEEIRETVLRRFKSPHRQPH